MTTTRQNNTSKKIENMTSSVVKATGSNVAVVITLGIVIVWAALGPVFHFSEKWENLIGTIILMVFLIQKSQNKDSLAIQLKLNELVAAHEQASNRLVNIEDMSEDELKVIQKYYSKLSDFAKKQESLTQSHSIDESHDEHTIKVEMEKELKNLSDPA
jgi:low affinity Fe/Cu permease